MTSNSDAEKSPNDTLAEDVANKLVEAGFVSKAKLGEVLTKVKAGTASIEDWKVWIDVSQKKDPGVK